MNVVVIHVDGRALLTRRGPLLARLAELGHTVHALAPVSDESTVTAIEELGVQYAAYPLTRGRFSPLADLSTLIHLKQVLFRIKPDVVLAVSGKAMTFGPMAARMAWVDHPKRIYALAAGLGYPFSKMAGWRRRIVHAYTRYFMGGGLGACHGIALRDEADRQALAGLGVLPENVPVTVLPETDGDTPDVDSLLSFMDLS